MDQGRTNRPPQVARSRGVSAFSFRSADLTIDRVLPLYDENPKNQTPVVVFLIIAACLALTAYEYILSDAELTRFVLKWAMMPANLRLGAPPEVWWTTLTCMFLHGGWAHVAGNCWFLWIFGNNVEARFGHFRFILFYVLAGLAAGAAQFLAGPRSTDLMVGASGAISGVIGAYVRHFPKAIIITLTPLWFAPLLPIPAFIFIFIWFGMQIWSGIGSIAGSPVEGGVAWWAHVGGFIAGFVLARPFAPKKRAARR